jgi:hypothetical protein
MDSICEWPAVQIVCSVYTTKLRQILHLVFAMAWSKISSAEVAINKPAASCIDAAGLFYRYVRLVSAYKTVSCTVPV